MSKIKPKELKAEYFRKDVQGLRAVAVLLVVLYHANFSIPFTLDFKGGFVGLDVLFMKEPFPGRSSELCEAW